jgi:predicted phosphodiesterase
MRYLVFGDVHGNIDALDTVLDAANALEVEGYLCVGDLVGYGPSPMECIQRLLELKQAGKLAWVAGNHELAIRGDLDSEGYNAEADKTLSWTASLIADDEDAKEFILSAPLTQRVDELIWLTHDSLSNPSSGHYHREPQSAKSELACLRHENGKVCFYGHTHSMRGELLKDGAIVLAMMETHDKVERDPKPLYVPAGQLGWIGTGSVGLPINPKRHTEFLILDDNKNEEWLIEKYALPYARDKAKERARAVLAEPCGQAVADRIARWL